MEKFTSRDMDHLGIVAQICDEIGLVQAINEIIPPHPDTYISVGESVKLMVINGLGFTSRPLYLESQFFSSKPVSRLLGRSLDAEEITDDRLGRALDSCYQANCDHLFAVIASKAVNRFAVNQKFRHLDSTSMHVHGEYEEGYGLIEFGYSKDSRPDLKQLMLSLVSSQDGDVPLLAQVLPGNTSDKTYFRQRLIALKEEIQASDTPSYYVADSALYTKETIQEISQYTPWITRVPGTINAAREAIAIPKEQMNDLGDGYYGTEIGSFYGQIRQRWLVLFSEKSYVREKKTLEKRIAKEAKKPLASAIYSCRNDAEKAVVKLEKTLRYHSLKSEIAEVRATGKRGRPRKEAPIKIQYKLKMSYVRSEDKIPKALQSKGKWIVATNELDSSRLSTQEMLTNYKSQQSVERGFRFLKDPLFMTSSIFLKKETRIVALGMIMCLCLLVYTLAQRFMRQRLAKLNETIPNQVGKPTCRPTMRWIFQCFEGVHVLYERTATTILEHVLNLNDLRLNVLRILGPPYEKIYANA